MESKSNKKYPKVYISFQLSEKANQLLTESCQRSGRKKIPEAALRLEDHLSQFRSISELKQTVPYENSEKLEMEIQDGCTSNT
ncbi:conjugal transfer protein TraY [Legionella beliardensis]|uniref:Relaxosome protein TraY n=1 Tax=Legionella beliardensis TaxID=91822 RepID=A0A378JTV2_9GAMM|nr:TraY domain-containing protein [Legionella beliardensis]STX55700.1 conjugal transfer protein TraY [Legionella beliardensis]